MGLPQTLDQLRQGLSRLVDDGQVQLRPPADDEEPVPGDTLLERQAHFGHAIRAAHGALETLSSALAEVERAAASLSNPARALGE